MMMEEAVTQQLTCALANGNPEVTDPFAEARRASRSVYYKERRLLDTLCNEGIRPVPVGLFYDAYFSNEAGENEESASCMLRRELERAFPSIDVLQKIAKLKPDDDIGKCVRDIMIESSRYKGAHPLRCLWEKIAMAK